MATTVTTSIGGRLIGRGNTIAWCGSCGCEGVTSSATFDLGIVGPGTYSVVPAGSSTCNVKSGGVFGHFASFNGQRFRNPADNGEWVFAAGSLSISIVEGANINPASRHDCINGSCVPTQMYGTPGVFGNFAACQSGCAKNSNCTGECVGTSELAALKQAANQLQARNCT